MFIFVLLASTVIDDHLGAHVTDDGSRSYTGIVTILR